MNAKILAVFIAILSVPAFAEDSCGMRSAQLFASGDIQGLAALFAPTSMSADTLKHMREEVGSLDKLAPASGGRFAKHQRISFAPGFSSASVIYTGYWINAESQRHGPIQIHVASKDKDKCELLAFQIDWSSASR